MAQLDHLIVPVRDRMKSLAFYTQIVGLEHHSYDGHFAVVRVTPDFVILLHERGDAGGMHLAFAMTKPEFDATFARLKAAGIAYGDAFDSVGNMRGPGRDGGARGDGIALYFNDPDRNLLEIRYYD